MALKLSQFTPVAAPGGGIGVALYHHDDDAVGTIDDNGYFDDVKDHVKSLDSPLVLAFGGAGANADGYMLIMLEDSENADKPVRKITNGQITFA